MAAGVELLGQCRMPEPLTRIPGAQPLKGGRPRPRALARKARRRHRRRPVRARPTSHHTERQRLARRTSPRYAAIAPSVSNVRTPRSGSSVVTAHRPVLPRGTTTARPIRTRRPSQPSSACGSVPSTPTVMRNRRPSTASPAPAAAPSASSDALETIETAAAGPRSRPSPRGRPARAGAPFRRRPRAPRSRSTDEMSRYRPAVEARLHRLAELDLGRDLPSVREVIASRSPSSAAGPESSRGARLALISALVVHEIEAPVAAHAGPAEGRRRSRVAPLHGIASPQPCRLDPFTRMPTASPGPRRALAPPAAADTCYSTSTWIRCFASRSGAAWAVGADGEDLGEDRQRRLLLRVRADVQPPGPVDAVERLLVDAELEQPLAAALLVRREPSAPM